jgi:hypothetical protein
LVPNNKKGSTGPIALCEGCFAKIDHIFEAETLHAQVLPALAMGVAAGVVAALVWYGFVAVTQYQLGIIAVGIGWLVARAVMFGSGGKRGGALPWISVGITLVSMVVSEYLIVRHFAVQALAEEGVTGIPLILPPGFMVQVVYEGLASDPLTLLFWIIALWQAYSMLRRRRLKPLKGAKANAS